MFIATQKKYIFFMFIFLMPCFFIIRAHKSSAFIFFGQKNYLDFSSSLKEINLNDNGFIFKTRTSASTVDDFLKDKKIKLDNHDQIIPELNSKIYPGSNVKIKRAVKMKVEVDNKKIEIYTLENTVGMALAENDIILTRLDKTSPGENFLPQNDLVVVVTRINVEEITVEESIDFKTIAKTDSKLGWREKKVEIAGEKGTKEVNYRITYKNGKEFSRVKLSQNITRDPVTQVEIQGTYMKLGKAAKGQGTWYAYQGGMFAASTSLAKGSYAKVTNTANGKSVVVQINDYGPQGKGRIIDLDKVAFAKIASLGAGVIGVKVEAVLN